MNFHTFKISLLDISRDDAREDLQWQIHHLQHELTYYSLFPRWVARIDSKLLLLSPEAARSAHIARIFESIHKNRSLRPDSLYTDSWPAKDQLSIKSQLKEYSYLQKKTKNEAEALSSCYTASTDNCDFLAQENQL